MLTISTVFISMPGKGTMSRIKAVLSLIDPALLVRPSLYF